MGFKPLEEIEGPIEIPFRGHVFTLPVLSYEDGVALQDRLSKGITQSELAEALTGGVLEELAQAGGSIELIQRVAAVAIADFRYGREIAERVWEDPKVLLDLNEAFRKAMATLSVEADTTSSRASGSGTRKKPADHRPRSRGKSSSASGTSS